MNKIKDVIGMVMTCGETISSIVSGDCFDDPIEDKVNSQPIRSYDPNDKIGYRSPAGSTYFNDEKKNFTYVINFENDAEKATAAAQEVFITDTLDLAMFDINSFRAGFIKIGSRVIQAPFDVQEHTWQVDLRPEMELRAEVKLTLDKTTGIARWHFKSIDPMTGELTTDPWAGFLPINDEKGSGQGLVSFSIDLKADIEEEAAVVNRAEIVFDTNEPLITDPWENIKDITPPISQMNQPAMVNESVVSLSWNATDNGSGVYRYALWANLDGGNFYQVAGDLSSTNYDFNYFPDHRYTFFVMATDSAMNKEAKTEGEVEFIVRSVKDIAVTPLEATIKVGETVQLTAVFDPTNATNQNTTWESSNLLAADVTQTGWVTGIGAGVSTITATSEEGGKSASAKITVSTPTGVDEATELTKVYTIEKRIIIEAPIGSACRIVTMSGAVVRTFTITEKIHEIGLPDGSYIVEIGDKRMKVVI